MEDGKAVHRCGRLFAPAQRATQAVRVMLLGTRRPPLFDVGFAGLLALHVLQRALTEPGETPGVRAVAIVIGLLQTVPLLWRRSCPDAAAVIVSVLMPLPFLARLPVPELTWLAAVYTLFAYRPVSRALPSGCVALAVVPVCAAGRVLIEGRPWGAQLAAWSTTLLPLLLAAAGLGATVGADRMRTAAQRAGDERAARAEALARHRAVIADDLNVVVGAEVRALADRTARLDERRALPVGDELLEGLRDVRRQARAALGSLRRTLQRLREVADPPPDQPPDPGTPPTRTNPRGWRLPTRSGIGLVGVLAVALLLVAVFPALVPYVGVQPAQRVVDPQSPVAIILAIVTVAAFAWWRSAPIPALLVVAATTTAASARDQVNYVLDTAPALLYYTAGIGAAPLLSGAAVAAAVVARITVDALTGAPIGGGYAFSVGVVGALWMVGVLQRRTRAHDRELLDRGASRQRQLALTDQRTRITRELHDLLGHHLSAVAVQAAAALSVARHGTLDAATLRSLSQSAGEAVRGLPTTTQPWANAPDLERLTEEAVELLVAPLRAGGLSVSVDVACTHPMFDPDEVDLFARRILQEALTNVLRHGGAAPTRVLVRDTKDLLHLQVRSGVSSGPIDIARGTGSGLVGMRERVDLLKGALYAGPDNEKGWIVDVHLPRRPREKDGTGIAGP